ncbi:hypothetical protein niasHT_034684 [Heterodera trifolii]|uniref:F-box domain-containing protein n=1 Tax=Heterodera trifolii TaxID=157864 RepID=A0ABD2IKV5_9BILA
MSQLLLDELFDDEPDQQQNGNQKHSTSASLLNHSASTTELISNKTNSTLGDEKSAKSASFFYANSSTQSLSELSTSTTLLCRSGEKKRGARHFSVDILPALKKQASEGGTAGGGAAGTHTALVPTKSQAAPNSGRSCTVYYDALAEQLLEDSSSCDPEPQLDARNDGGTKCVLNPVFCTDEEEGGNIFTGQTEEANGEHFADQRTEINCSQERLIKDNRKKDTTESAETEKQQPHQQHQKQPPLNPAASSLLLLSNSCAGTGGGVGGTNSAIRKRQRGQMRLFGTAAATAAASASASSGAVSAEACDGAKPSKALSGGGGGGTSVVAPLSMSINDGLADPSSTAALGVITSSAGSGGKRVVQAKHNQMYLITTLLPTHGSVPQNGNNAQAQQQQQNGVHHHHNNHSQSNGHRRNTSSQHMPSAALINRILPTELILRVFSYLDITSLGRCAQVCRTWNKLAMDGSNWMEVDLFSFQREVKTTVVESLAKRCGNFLKVLSLKGCENVQDNAMRSFAAKCPNIEQLTLAKCKLVTDATCEYIGRYCHRIVMIDLENCTLITDIAMKFIGEGCKRLEEINLSWCEQITDLGIGYIGKNCPNLRTFFCKGLENLSSQSFRQLVMHELRALNLFSCPNITDETVADVAKNCHQLEFISLSNCKEITDLAIVSISQGCPKIRDLELAGCTNLTDSGFVQLSKTCHELERIDLEECLLITDSTLTNFNGCPNLYSLSLSHCENLTDTGLAELCVAHRERLQVLELDNCPNITDHTLESMKHLKLLERVDLYDCQLVSKDAIKKFKQTRPDVEVHAYFAPATPPPPPPPARRGICRCCVIL